MTTLPSSIMKRPSAASLVLFGFSLGLFASANAATLGSAVFPDVTSGAYFNSAVGDMYAAGIITGYNDGRFGPNDYVTRGQVAVMMQRLKAHLTGQDIVANNDSSSSRTRVSSSSSSTSSSSDSSDSSIVQTNHTEGSIRFTTGSYKAEEDEGEQVINLIRYGGNAGAVTVEYEVEAGTATAGDDYEVVSGTLSFADGKTSASFTIPVIDDNEAEDSETVLIKIKNPGGGASIGTPDVATLTIVDNDEGDGSTLDPENTKGVFVFSAAEYEIAEDMSSVVITVDRTSGTDGTATVKIDTTNGSADSSYYDTNNATLTFNSGESSKTITINVKDNSGTNGNKTVNLKLSNPTGGATLGSLSTSVLVIVDDEISEFGNGKFRLSESEYETYEGEVALITIDRRNGASGEVEVDYATQNTLAKSGEDYTETSGTLVFKEGETQKIIAVPILDDTKDDNRETFRFKISNATGGATIDVPNEAIITIQ